MNYVLGIDLGTTNCSVTAVDENGKTIVIKNRDGEYITPSAVYFNETENSFVIGKRAKAKAAEDSKERLVTIVKREMGKSKDQVRERKLTRKCNPYDFWGKRFSPEEISSFILGQLKEDAEKELGCEVKQAIITCPAYFGQREKEATRLAGELAGFDVLEVIPEPTAAAISYGTITDRDNERIFVFDLGGGTFDVTILVVSNGVNGKQINTVGTGGSRKLGGVDWDELVMDHMCEGFANKYGPDLARQVPGHEGERNVAIGKLSLDVEKAKKELSKPNAGEVKIALSFQGMSYEESFTKEKFANITFMKTQECMDYCTRLLKDSSLNWSDIDTVLMVGSMSNCLFIQEELKKLSGKEVKFGEVNPKTCVSEGAAIWAYTKICEQKGVAPVVQALVEKPRYDAVDDDKGEAEKVVQIEKQDARKEVKIQSVTNVLSSPIKLSLLRNGQPFAFEMLKKNQTYPCSFHQAFPLHSDGQTSVELVVLENESDNPANCDRLGSAFLTLRGQHFRGDKVDVKFEVDANGIIQVSGVDLRTGEATTAVIRRENSMSEAEVEQAKQSAEEFVFELP